MRLITLALTAAGLLCAQSRMVDLKGVASWTQTQVKVAPVEYAGKKGVSIARTPEAKGENSFALVPGIEFQDGTIEVELAGKPGAGAGGEARGFIGLVFRVQAGGSKYESFYIRPTNGRAEDQVRRNHSSQYVSFPDFPWPKLRKETPEKYEAYVDLEPGVWTKVKVEVAGEKARLFVHGATQPTLIVNDLKHGVSKGGVGIWVGPGTEGHFTNVRVESR